MFQTFFVIVPALNGLLKSEDLSVEFGKVCIKVHQRLTKAVIIKSYYSSWSLISRTDSFVSLSMFRGCLNLSFKFQNQCSWAKKQWMLSTKRASCSLTPAFETNSYCTLTFSRLWVQLNPSMDRRFDVQV